MKKSKRVAKARLQYRSPVSAAIHEAAEDLYSIGAIDTQRMCKFDESCLTPVPKKKHRASLKISLVTKYRLGLINGSVAASVGRIRLKFGGGPVTL